MAQPVQLSSLCSSSHLNSSSTMTSARDSEPILTEGVVVDIADELTGIGIDIVDIVVTKHHALALDSSGEAWSWGQGSSGQLGLGSREDSLFAPRPIHLHDRALAIAASDSKLRSLGCCQESRFDRNSLTVANLQRHPISSSCTRSESEQQCRTGEVERKRRPQAVTHLRRPSTREQGVSTD